MTIKQNKYTFWSENNDSLINANVLWNSEAHNFHWIQRFKIYLDAIFQIIVFFSPKSFWNHVFFYVLQDFFKKNFEEDVMTQDIFVISNSWRIRCKKTISVFDMFCSANLKGAMSNSSNLHLEDDFSNSIFLKIFCVFINTSHVAYLNFDIDVIISFESNWIFSDDYRVLVHPTSLKYNAKYNEVNVAMEIIFKIAVAAEELWRIFIENVVM